MLQKQTLTQLRTLRFNGIADAILDRLLHNSDKLELKGESMKKMMSSLTEDEHLG